jgi:hypothetical protein
MDWARILAYVTGTVDQEMLARNEYLAAENRILKAQLKGRLKLSEAERATTGSSGRSNFLTTRAWGDPKRAAQPALHRQLALACDYANACNIHGHDHATAWSSKLPITDLKAFWGALGCACWAI